jgi:hypothetical protein
VKIACTYPDVERATVDFLTGKLGGATVGTRLPPDWTKQSTNHLMVRCDGTPTITYPITARPTVRLVAWSGSPTEAKALAMLAQGVYCAHPGDSEISGVQALTGLLPGYDPDHEAELASVTCRAVIRSIPI